MRTAGRWPPFASGTSVQLVDLGASFAGALAETQAALYAAVAPPVLSASRNFLPSSMCPFLP